MGRLVVFVIALTVLGLLAARYLTSSGSAHAPATQERSFETGTPKQTMDNARAAAKRIEADDERRANELLEKSDEH